MKIGLSYTGTEVKHHNYVNWLKGDEPVEIITLSAGRNNAQKLLECDALVLSGGIDMDPAISNGRDNYPNRPEKFEPQRDRFEIALFKTAVENHLPVLGICRGMQLINVVQGGTLVDDLGEKNERHQKIGSADKSHPVQINDGTMLARIVQQPAGEINSAHHQAVGIPGKNLRPNCLAEDGTIEGLEWQDKKDRPFLLCVQWHPERMFQFPGSPFSLNIRNHFIGEIKRSIDSKK